MNNSLVNSLKRMKVTEVRLVFPSPTDSRSSESSVLSLAEAFSRAKELGVDLVEVTPFTQIRNGGVLQSGQQQPPVVRAVDYKKLLVEKKFSDAAAKKENKVRSPKEYKFRVGIGANDRDMRIAKMIDNMVKGYPAKVTILARHWEIKKTPDCVKAVQVFIFAAVEGLVKTDSTAKTPSFGQASYQVNFSPKESIEGELKKRKEKEELFKAMKLD